ncbi:MAG: M1 family metallopeptidase [Flavobacteriales bacterium]
MNFKQIAVSFGILLSTLPAFSQYWQQSVKYKIDFELDDKNHHFKGEESIDYTNNSPDALTHLYFHLYFNAFQPGSAMDIRSLLINDPDPRVADRISKLSPEEYGEMHVTSMKVDGKSVTLEENGTILEVTLAQPIASGKTVNINLEFNGQVPIQIRRSGRNNVEGIDYSMTQWYPKLCEYDVKGWHPNPYIGREFYGIWGDFEVNITLNKKYIIGGTGELQNACEIGYGYCEEAKVKRASGDKLTWKFTAKNVHDFAWAADPDYVHETAQVPDGPSMHFFYQNDPSYANSWKDGKELVLKGFKYLSDHFGKYPYSQYTVIQGGDGGMEYPMATLITGNRKTPSFVGVTLHEAAHSWYQGVLATNESLYPWMDEGFTSYASSEAFNSLYASRIPGDHSSAYQGYLQIVEEGKEEALITHADHYITNYAYGTASYNKGEVYLAQLAYVIGKENFDKGILAYFDKWKFKHPTDEDFLHVMELQSNMVLDWYNEYFVHTTKTIDYGIKEVSMGDKFTSVTLERVGLMPMPVDVEVTFKNGKKTMYTIPLDLMRGAKAKEDYPNTWVVSKDWDWVNPFYELHIEAKLEDIHSIVVDPENGMADTNRNNNSVVIENPIYILKLD